eukprot:scaffold125065_cov24-Phaeocystis_antarctica.AAC.1
MAPWARPRPEPTSPPPYPSPTYPSAHLSPGRTARGTSCSCVTLTRWARTRAASSERTLRASPIISCPSSSSTPAQPPHDTHAPTPAHAPPNTRLTPCDAGGGGQA